MHLKVFTGIDIEGSLGVVGFPAVLGGTVTGEVLHHAQNAVLAPAQIVAFLVKGGLQSAGSGIGHIPGQRGVFTEGSAVSAPAGLGVQVNLGPKELGNTQSPKFLGNLGVGDGGVLRVEGGRQRQVVGIIGHALAPAAVARIGTEQNGNTVVAALGIGLKGVGELYLVFHIRTDGGSAHAPNSIVNSGLLLVIQLGRKVVGIAAAEYHQSGDFVQGHLGNQIRRPGVGIFSPVLVNIQLTVLIQILEDQAICLQQLHATVRIVAQLRDTCGDDPHPVVHLLLGVSGSRFTHGHGQISQNHGGCQDT